MGWSRRTPDRFYKNCLQYSQNLGNPAWLKYYGATIGAKVLAPDGTLTADSVTGTSQAEIAQIIPASMYVVGTPFCASVWYRATSSPINLLIELGDIQDGDPVYTSTAAVVTTWKRFSVSGTVATGITTLSMFLGGRLGTFPTNQAVEMWGAQLVFGTTELGKYRPTAACAAG